MDRAGAGLGHGAVCVRLRLRQLRRKVAVFWYDFEDAYLSSVRQILDQSLTKAGVSYQDYDAKGSQTAQIEQIQSAIAEGSPRWR